MSRRLPEDEYIRQVRMKRKKREDEDAKEIKGSVFALVAAMLIIVGIFAFTMFRSAKNPQGELPVSPEATADLAQASPSPSEEVKIPELPEEPTEDPSETPTENATSPTPGETADVPDDSSPKEIPTETPTGEKTTAIPTGDAPDIPDDTETPDDTPTPDDKGAPTPLIRKTTSPSRARVTFSRPLIRPEIPGISIPKIDFVSVEMIGMKAPAPRVARVKPKTSGLTKNPGDSGAKATETPTDGDTDVPTAETAHIIVYQSDFDDAQAFLWNNITDKRLMLKFEKVGDNRYKAVVSPGNYTLRIVKTDYRPYNTKFELKSGKKLEINEPLEKSDRATLTVTSMPAGASVYLDGKNMGVTPATIGGLENRRYGIRLLLNGYKPAQSTIVVDYRQNNTKHINLAPLRGPGGR